MLHLFCRTLIIALIPLVLFSCSSIDEPVKPMAEINDTVIPPLKVGITPDYPPLIFKQAQKITGVEADLARKLAEELGRPLEFVELSFDQQIPALMQEKIDIIMSGLTITKAREVRINFAEHYLKSGLFAAFRTEDTTRYNSIDNILNCDGTVGVLKGTSGAVFAKKNILNSERIFELSKARDGGIELKRTAIDLFINDAPSIIWLVSENEADLMGFWERLNTEYLAWGIKKDNQELMTDVNSLLEKWKNNGSLDSILEQWLPYKEFYQ